MSDIRNVVIVGSGPAGLTAAIYTARANLEPLVLEGEPSSTSDQPGGQLMLTTDVENFPGFPEGVMGPDLMMRFREQAVRFGAEARYEKVSKVDFSERPFKLWVGDPDTEEPTYRAHAVIIATGSEVQLALQAQALLAERKIAVRVVSMPSTTTFDRQSPAYKAEGLPAGLPRVAVEMGVTDGWWKYGCAAVVGIDTYGESAPAPVLFKHFGFTEENVAATVLAALKRK